MANHILLINPWIHDFTAFDLWTKPLGLLYIASTLNHFGYKVNLVDCLYGNGYLKERGPYSTGHFFSQEIEKPHIYHKVPRRFKRYGMPFEEFGNILKALPKPLLVCVTSHMTYWYPGVFETIKMVKDFFTSVPVALGGIYATICYEHAKDNSGADYVIKGPGELEVLKLADNLAEKRRNYSSVKNWIEKEIHPAYELYPKLDSVSIITTRGCPFHCTYCASFILNQKFIFRDPDIVVAEIEKYVTKLMVNDIAFYDDALFVDSKRHIIPILELLIDKKLDVRFHTPNGLHAGYINNELANLLCKAGFRTLRLSFEGLSKRVQNASTNKVSCHDLVNALNYLKSAGRAKYKEGQARYPSLDIGIYILLGLPGQTFEEVVDTMQFVNKVGGKIKLAEYSPVPGTEEFQRAAELCADVVTEPLNHNKSAFATIGMDIDYKTFQELKTIAKRLNMKVIKEKT